MAGRKEEVYLPTEESCCHFLCPRSSWVTPESTVKLTCAAAMETGELELPGSTASRGLGLVKGNQGKYFPKAWEFKEPVTADVERAAEKVLSPGCI